MLDAFQVKPSHHSTILCSDIGRVALFFFLSSLPCPFRVSKRHYRIVVGCAHTKFSLLHVGNLPCLLIVIVNSGLHPTLRSSRPRVEQTSPSLSPSPYLERLRIISHPQNYYLDKPSKSRSLCAETCSLPLGKGELRTCQRVGTER